jgi:WD40 repeat protein
VTAKFEPYVGPRPFTRKDHSIFFGRDRETNELLSLIIAHPVVLIYAQSGAGKTSLLNARLIPLLEEHHSEVLGTARVNGELPKEVEAIDIENIYLFNALISLQKDRAASKHLTQLSLAEFLKQRPHPARLEGLSYRRVILFDQFEEIFTAFPDRWQNRGKFFDNVGQALEEDPRLRVVFAMREEYIANMDSFASALPERLRTRFRLERLREEAALQAVKKPLEATGRSYASGVAEDLVKNLLRVPIKSATGTIDISGEFIEPVQLQVVCQKLWRALPPDVHEIDARYIEDYGDVDEALSAYYEDCIKQAAEKSGVKEGLLRRWFGEKLITSDGTRGTVYKDVQTTGGLANEVVSLLEDLRLVRPEMRGGAPWYELTHDRFIGPILQSNEKWFNQRIKSRLIAKTLEARAKEWQHNQRPATALLSGDELLETEQWMVSPDAEDLTVSDTLREFVQASRIEAERKRAEAQTRIATGLRRQRVVLVLIGLIAVAMAIYTFRAQRQESRARRQAEDAALIERGNIAKSLAAQEDKEFDALVLGIRAVGPRLKEGALPPDEAVEGLRAAVKAVGNPIWLRDAVGSTRTPVFSSDGSRVLTFAASGLSVWNAVTGELLFSKPLEKGRSYPYPMFTPDGVAVLAQIQETHKRDGSPDKEQTDTTYTLQLFDSQSGAELESIFKGAAYISNIQFSQDSKRLAFIEGKYIHVMDTGTKQSLLVVSAPPGVTQQMKLLPDGRYAYWQTKNNEGVLWDVNSARQIAKLRSGGGTASSSLLISGSPDSKQIAIASGITIDVWETNTGKRLVSKRVELDTLDALKFSSNNKVLALGRLHSDNSQKMLISLDTNTGQETTYKQFHVAYDISSILNETGLILNSTSSSEPENYFRFREYYIRGLDPRRYLSQTGELSVFDGFSGQVLFNMKGGVFSRATLSPDGKRLVISKGENRMQVIELGQAVLATDDLPVAELFSIACQQMRYQPEYSQVAEFCQSVLPKQ